MELQILISTLNQPDTGFYKQLFHDNHAGQQCLIVNQICDDESLAGWMSEERKINNTVVWIDQEGKGLSISRNTAITNATGDVCIIADDDIRYVDGFGQKVIDYHNLYYDYDILIFMAITPDGLPFRKYPEAVRKVTRKIAGGVSSIEITFKLRPVKEKKILFDERFGLGSMYPAGEEWIFITDALKKGLKVLFIPEYIVMHPKANSGMRFTESRIMALGATMFRVYGMQAYIRYFIFLKNIRKIHLESHSLFSFFYFFLKGMLQCQFKRG